jgi:hypothetical protein
MPQQDDDQHLREIEEWFREHEITLQCSEIVGDQEPVEWVALMIRDGQNVGAGGVGVTKLAAAEDARRRYVLQHGMGREFVESGSLIAGASVGGSAATARAEANTPSVKIEVPRIDHERTLWEPTVSAIPSEVREPLEQIAAEYGWYVSGVNEPDGSIRWFVFDRDRDTLFKSGIAKTWDDARLAMIEDLYPPSGEC